MTLYKIRGVLVEAAPDAVEALTAADRLLRELLSQKRARDIGMILDAGASALTKASGRPWRLSPTPRHIARRCRSDFAFRHLLRQNPTVGLGYHLPYVTAICRPFRCPYVTHPAKGLVNAIGLRIKFFRYFLEAAPPQP